MRKKIFFLKFIKKQKWLLFTKKTKNKRDREPQQNLQWHHCMIKVKESQMNLKNLQSKITEKP